ncbi:hypothetical protein FB451DRAFT_323169 [Mycena latifolia]|nr:hypothetical protein FB451DRAFT_323169 [Mycena latifolia]
MPSTAFLGTNMNPPPSIPQNTHNVAWPSAIEITPRLEEVLSPAEMAVTPRAAPLQPSTRENQPRFDDIPVPRDRTKSSVSVGDKCKRLFRNMNLRILAPRPELGDGTTVADSSRSQKASPIKTICDVTETLHSAKNRPLSESPLYFSLDDDLQWDPLTRRADRDDPFGPLLSQQDYKSGSERHMADCSSGSVVAPRQLEPSLTDPGIRRARRNASVMDGQLTS